MIDVIIAMGIGFIAGSFMTVAVLALCMVAKETDDERKKGG